MENITGLMIYYLNICHKKLWYHLKNINLESNSENVGIGKLLDDQTYSNERKHIGIDGVIDIDFIKDWKILHDIKKSKSMEVASIWQMKYYLYYLKKKGVKIEKGIIDYPLIRQRKEVYLEEDDENKIIDMINKIQYIKQMEKPPNNIESKICKHCAYYEYCYC